ncbi:MAG: GTPase Era [Acidobacteriota bacterium]|nr:GTPase Era [Acidobacteriota bacterium]
MKTRSGIVTLAGRPNAGKSTLMNRLLGEKLAIVSDKPQTTRHRLVGILTDEKGQIVFYDTPGVHRPLHRMNRQMVRHAVDAMGEGDIVCLLVDATTPFGSGDAYMLELIQKSSAPRIAILNKIDRVKKPDLLPRIGRYAETEIFEQIVPVSALTGDGCDRLMEVLWQGLPEGEPLYDADLYTLHPERFLAAETIREKILLTTRNELPFTTAVVIEKWEEAEAGDHARIYACILVEKPGQKAILIGRKGENIKRLGIAARRDLQELLGRRVHLELFVRHEPGWREDRRLLAEIL